MELGGNIELINFDDIEPGKLVVVKKIVGNFTKKITDSGKAFERLVIDLIDKEKNIVKGTLVVEGKEKTEEASDNNLFFALNNLLSKLSA